MSQLFWKLSEQNYTLFWQDIGQFLALPKFIYSIDMSLCFKTKATQKQLQSKIEIKVWTFHLR